MKFWILNLLKKIKKSSPTEFKKADYKNSEDKDSEKLVSEIDNEVTNRKNSIKIDMSKDDSYPLW